MKILFQTFLFLIILVSSSKAQEFSIDGNCTGWYRILTGALVIDTIETLICPVKTKSI